MNSIKNSIVDMMKCVMNKCTGQEFIIHTCAIPSRYTNTQLHISFSKNFMPQSKTYQSITYNKLSW